MKIKRILMLTCLLCALCLCFPASVQAEGSAFAADMRLEKAEGSVQLTNRDGRALSLREGMKLYSGYGVATGEGSCAYIRLDADRAVKLDANTRVTILKQNGLLEMTLETGGLFFDIGKPLEADEQLNIRTTTMVTGIHGTSGMVLHFEQDDVRALMDYWQLYSGDRPVRTEDLMYGAGNMLTFIGVMDGQVETATADGQDWPIAAGEAGVIVIENRGGEKRMLFFDMTGDDVPLFVGVEITEGSGLWDRINAAMSQLTARDIADSVRKRLRLTKEEALSLPECTCAEPDPYTVPALPASCETDGFDAFERCALCGGRLGSVTVRPALGHDEVVLPAWEATCSRSGRLEGAACARCEAILKPQEYLRAQHDLSDWFCDESVNMHYRDCMKDCGYSEQGSCADDPEQGDGYCDVCGGPVG